MTTDLDHRPTISHDPAPAVAEPQRQAPGHGHPHDIATSALAAPATRLPFFDAIQRSFGHHSIANIRAHTGGGATSAARQLGATGFAFGEDVVLADSASLHVVAHEAAHVIQQRGRATFSGLGQAGDEHEQHAEEVAQLVERGESAEKILDQYAPTGQVQTARTIQLFAGERPTDYGAVTKDPNWLPRADAYEKRLGLHAYGHAVSRGAVDAALARMQAVLLQHYAVDAANAAEKEKLYREAFTKDDKTSAGQIGTGSALATIEQMLTTGNLRERLTAFYNAAYYNTANLDPAAAIPRGFKAIAKGILFDDSPMAGLNLDEAKLRELATFNKSYWRTGAKVVTGIFDWFQTDDKAKKSYNFADDPFALGNLSLAAETAGTGEIATSQYGRTNASNLERAARAKSPAQYAQMPLSARELAHAQSQEPAVNADPVNGMLPWVPGHAYFNMPNQGHWVDSMRTQLRMPVIAGVSGTTTRLLSAFQWLNPGVSALDFRLALIGWMLPIGDHSLYEILRGATLAGVRHPQEGDLDDPVRMYMNVGPLPTAEWRQNAGHNGMFPHEELYMARAGGGKDTPTGMLGADATNRHGAVAANPEFTPAHATAIYTYTTGMHMVMNSVLTARIACDFSPELARVLIKTKLMTVVDHRARLAFLRHKQGAGGLSGDEAAELLKLANTNVEPIEILTPHLPGWLVVLGDSTQSPGQLSAYRSATVMAWIDANMDRIYDELVAHANMAVEGLKQLPAAPPQVVYRGDWKASGVEYRPGHVIPVDTLQSYSTNEVVAKNFMSEGKFSNKVLFRMQTKAGGSGRDIRALSKIPMENELLLIPGARFVVTRIEQQVGYELIHCTEQ